MMTSDLKYHFPSRSSVFLLAFFINFIIVECLWCDAEAFALSITLDKTREKYEQQIAHALYYSDFDQAERLLNQFQMDIEFIVSFTFKRFRWATEEEVRRARESHRKLTEDLKNALRRARQPQTRAAPQTQPRSRPPQSPTVKPRTSPRTGPATPPIVVSSDPFLKEVEKNVERFLREGKYNQALNYLKLTLNQASLDEVSEKRIKSLMVEIKSRMRSTASSPRPTASPPSKPAKPTKPTKIRKPRPRPKVKSGPEVHKMEFVFIPAGEYFFGTPSNEPGRDPALELPVQKIYMKGFFISTTEVTQETYVHYQPSAKSEYKKLDRPVHGVDFKTARTFCRKLTWQDDKFDYDLPNEIEWEISCRSGQHPDIGPVDAPERQERFQKTVGMAAQAIQPYAIFNRNNGASVIPLKVKQKKPNSWDLYDMHGNVAEWCERVTRRPQWYKDQLGNQPIRGGSFLSDYKRCRAGSRALERADSKSPTIGFRIIARYR